MAKSTDHTVTVHSVERIQSSTNGNPRYQLNTDKGPFRTAVDTQCGYTVTNDFSEYGDYAIPAVLHCENGNSMRVIGWELR